jgi:hypothetical protein
MLYNRHRVPPTRAMKPTTKRASTSARHNQKRSLNKHTSSSSSSSSSQRNVSSSPYDFDDDEQKTVNYFAYGSNLSSKTFEGRRNMKPVEKTNCVLYGYELRFNVPGIPYVEPGFASVYRETKEEGEGSFVHGVCYTLLKEDFEYLVKTEGSYDVRDVELVEYDSLRIVNAKTLTHRDVVKTKLNPSRRYLGLIVEGAKEQRLDQKWIEKLEGEEYYDPAKKELNPFELAILIAALPLVVARSFGEISSLFIENDERFREASVDKKLIETFIATQKALYDVHDDVFEKVIGSGVRNNC